MIYDNAGSPILAWHGKPELKAETVARMRKHAELDEFAAGYYLARKDDKWTGCFHGCLSAEVLAEEIEAHGTFLGEDVSAIENEERFRPAEDNTAIAQARKNHFDKHSRTLPIEQCDVSVCKWAARGIKAEPLAIVNRLDSDGEIEWHAMAEKLFGIPFNLAALLDQLFEDFDTHPDCPWAADSGATDEESRNHPSPEHRAAVNKAAGQWAVKVVETIAVGADLSGVGDYYNQDRQGPPQEAILRALAAAPVPAAASTDGQAQ